MNKFQNLINRINAKKAFTKVSPTQIDYMDAMLNNGEQIDQEPRIKVSTIHGAKGGEATNVVLFLNQTTNTMAGAKKSIEKQTKFIFGTVLLIIVFLVLQKQI